jgi:hypothetical protein
MITLKTLPNATAQEVFEQSAKHLLSQNAKSISIDSKNCMYKQGSLACAAGCFIADDEYSPAMEEMGWSYLALLGKVPSAHMDLIQDLQMVHDELDIAKWKQDLIHLAISYQLDHSFL